MKEMPTTAISAKTSHHRGYRVKIVGQVSMLVRKSLPAIYEAFGSLFVGPIAYLAPTYGAARRVYAVQPRTADLFWRG